MKQNAFSVDALIAAKFDHVERERADMHQFQTEDVEFFKTHPFSYGLLDLGLGKSVTAGTLIADLNLDNIATKVLIVGPIAVIATSWPDELRTWRHLAPLTYTVLREDDDDLRLKAARSHDRKTGEKTEAATRVRIRHELARQNTTIHLVNFESLEWLCEFWKGRWPYRTVIVDEAHAMKSHDSNRFKALSKMRNTPGLITRMHLLTATPASENYMGFFAMTFLLDGGVRFGKHITKFQSRYFIQDRYTFSWKLRPDAEQEILAKIADIATIRKRREHFDTKEATIVQRRFMLGQRARDLYTSMSDDMVLALGDETVITADTAAALSQKLSQMASGVVYETALLEPEGYDPDLDDEAPDLLKVRRVHHVHDHKIDMLRDVLAELDGENVLVSYQHRSSLDRLQKAFPKAVKWDKTGKSKAGWNAGKIPMLLMHPRSGGAGQNLQKGGCHIVFFDIPWSRTDFVQLIGRLDRQGQQRHVTVILLVAADTIDERIAKAQQEKKMNEEEMFRILKSYVKKLRQRRNT